MPWAQILAFKKPKQPPREASSVTEVLPTGVT